METSAWQIDRVLDEANAGNGLRCESSLRVAAATLRNCLSPELSSATVVGVLGRDDLSMFRELVTDIAEQYDLDARVKVKLGSFSVRFTREALDATPTSQR